jgi:hypothetical protein
MAEKSSNLELYASDDLDKKSLIVNASSNVTRLECPDKLVIASPVVQLSGSTDPDHDITDLASYLYTQKTAKAAKDTAQDASIQTNADNIAQEILDRANAVATVDDKVTAEITRATGAEATLQGNIDSEAIARSTGDAALQSSINAEETARIDAISSETSSRTASDTSIRTDFATADTALNDRIDALLAGTDVDTDTLIEIVNAYKLADTNILSTITTLQSDLTTLTNRFNTAFPASAEGED